jgi:lysine 2,3-aminomutase
MAASVRGVFAEKLSPYLQQKLEAARLAGADHRVLNVLERQYLRDSRESLIAPTDVSRHYEASIPGMPGVERLYRTTILVEPTTTCAAHCRWCLRARYEPLQMTPEQIDAFARYCGDPVRAGDLSEVLVTGGDPLLVPRKLERLFEALAIYAPNIHTYRIGTRLPLQAPERIDRALLDVVRRFADAIDIGVHVNHSLEIFPEVRDALEHISETGARLYNHSVLLRGVNDSAGDLVELCDLLRSLHIENHYLFHCIPMEGMRHHRTSVGRGLALARQLASSGAVAGRSRPVFALLTAVGKVVLYEGTIVGRDGPRLLVRTEFDAAERARLTPSWRRPASAFEAEDGRLMVWYEDGTDDD